jgi:hypothetical protein
MRTQSADTSPAFEKVWIERMRQMPGWRRLQLASQLSASARKLCWAGLKSRHPDATEDELRRMFAEVHWGKELAGKYFASKRT